MDKQFNVNAFAYVACFVVVAISVGSLLMNFAPKGIPPPTAGNAQFQAGVASAAPLVAVASNDPTVQQAIDATQPGAVSSAAGTNGNVKGALTNIFYPTTSAGTMVLCFGTGAHSTQIHVPSADFSKLPDMRDYIGKTLMVKGSIGMGVHLPFVNASSPDGIKVVK